MTEPVIRVLYVSYPLLTVSEESAGGAEQMLCVLEREMHRGGWETTVAASAGSRISGELFVTGEACSQPDDFERRKQEHQDRVVALVQQRNRECRPFDLIHDESGCFWTRAHELDVPVLATLHLPRHFYLHLCSEDSFKHIPENVSFNCVSQSQANGFSDIPRVLGVVPNGIALDRFMGHDEPAVPRSGLLWLGRICEEKAPHLALDIAERAREEITVAGQVYPFSYHQQYFEREIASRLNKMLKARWVESPSFPEKVRLLKTAEAVLITSQVDETSSLAAMEAAACGTPVIAFNRGALADVVRNGVTGFVVNDASEAGAAIGNIGQISGEDCRDYAQQNFSSHRMAERYAEMYEALLGSGRAHAKIIFQS
jgi:glycosyltransferase involved in cell wall biosynthesis